MVLARFLSLILLSLWLGIGSALAEKRVALVVGNDRYQNLPSDRQLQRAVSDARAVGDTLRTIGFDVIPGENLGRQAMVDKLDEMTRRLSPGDIAFFFFAGHGVAIGGGNYLLPSDVPNVESGQETRLGRAAIGENDIVSDLQQRGVRVAVVVLDACRDNPFRRPGVRSVGGERGLGRVEPARGAFTLYSAGLGQMALDRLGNADRNPNSVFTRTLLPKLARPGLDLTALAIEVREEVARLAGSIGHDQRPAYYDETIGGRIFLAGLPGPATGQSPGGAAGLPTDAAERAWNEIRTSTNVAVFEEFVRHFGESFYAALAKNRIEELKRSQTAVLGSPGTVPSATSGPCGGAGTVSLTSRPARALSPNEECSLKPKDGFKECDKCPEMIVVPSGRFTMGSPSSETGRGYDEGPQHQVTFSRNFVVGQFAVTFEEWDACVADGGCNGYRPSDEGWGRSRRPVINVSWGDGQTYVKWLSSKTGKTYRLLSEAEREYVTRAGTETPFWWGASSNPNQANYDGNYTYNNGPKGLYRKQTVPVDTFAPNSWGLYQVHGNLSEWTEDCWNANYNGAPTDGRASTSGDCNHRVLRGGSWNTHPWNLRAAFRGRSTSSVRNNVIGFRVARTLTP